MTQEKTIKDTILSFKISTIVAVWAVFFAVVSTVLNKWNSLNNEITSIKEKHHLMEEDIKENNQDIHLLQTDKQAHELEFTKVITEINSDIRAIKSSVLTIEKTIEKTH